MTTTNDLKNMLKEQEEWESRLLPCDQIKQIFESDDVKDPCVDCGESTAFGSGNFVNRIPADRRLEDGTVIDGYMCPTCQSPPVCYECGYRHAEYLDFRCKVCNEELIDLSEV